MKLRIGGIQNVINQALEKEQAKANAIIFYASSVAFSGETQNIEVNWFAPAGVIRQSSSRVDIRIPYTQEMHAQILKLAWANKVSTMIIESPSGSTYELKGAYISEVHEMYYNSAFIDLCITYTHFFFGELGNNPTAK